MTINAARAFPPGDEQEPGLHDANELSRALHLAAMREHGLRSLAELGQNLSASPDLFHLTDLALFNLMGHFGTSKAALWVRSEVPGAPLVLVRAHGVPDNIARTLGAACSHPLLEKAVGHKDPMTLDQFRELGADVQATMAERSGFAVIAPVPAREDTLGMVALGTRIGGLGYGPVEFQSLHAALSVLGVALQNRALLARLVDSNRQLRRANEDLHDIGRIKSEFMSNVNHELCTPLAVIIGYVEALLGNGTLRERDREVLDVVLSQASKLHGLIRNLLTFSEATQGLLTMELARGDAGACVRRFCEERRPGASARLRELMWHIDEGLPVVQFDDKRLTQVVDALVDNAIKFTPEGSRVDVHVRHELNFGGSWLAIDISDNGPGIPEDRVPVLFEAFRQADGSSTRLVGGLGMGLSFSRQLVTAMGGKIAVESIPGQGARFTVLLPEV